VLLVVDGIPCASAQEPVRDEPPTPLPDAAVAAAAKLPAIVLTGASSNHAGPLREFLENYSVQGKAAAPLVVYDFGLTFAELEQFKSMHTWIHRWETFDYSRWPPHVNIAVNRGHEGWKVGAIAMELQQADVVLWLDPAAKLATASTLPAMFAKIQTAGVVSVLARSGNVAESIYPASLKEIDRRHPPTTTTDQQQAWKLCNGAVVGFHATNKAVQTQILDAWFDCVVDSSQCVAPLSRTPEGAISQGEGFRWQAESLLTVLMGKQGQFCTQDAQEVGILLDNNAVQAASKWDDLPEAAENLFKTMMSSSMQLISTTPTDQVDPNEANAMHWTLTPPCSTTGFDCTDIGYFSEWTRTALSYVKHIKTHQHDQIIITPIGSVTKFALHTIKRSFGANDDSVRHVLRQYAMMASRKSQDDEWRRPIAVPWPKTTMKGHARNGHEWATESETDLEGTPGALFGRCSEFDGRRSQLSGHAFHQDGHAFQYIVGEAKRLGLLWTFLASRPEGSIEQFHKALEEFNTHEPGLICVVG
jgi:hypothetical protein